MRIAAARKSRKRQFNAHNAQVKHFMHAHVTKDLREKVKSRAVAIKKGYKVKVLRGENKGKEGQVLSVSFSKRVVFVEGITRANARGKDKPLPLHPSNLLITNVG